MDDRAKPNEPIASSFLFRAGVMETLACGLAALVYAATLSFGFVYDDVPQILKNPAIRDWRFVTQYFTEHVWAAIYPGVSGNYYRPVFLLWLRLNYALFGNAPAGWHLTSVACHVMATWLVFRLTQKLSGNRLTAFLAGLLFGLHPAHVENVAWISGVTDPLTACFFLGSLCAFFSYRQSRKGAWAAISLGLFALALLSKETAVVLPLLIFAAVVIQPFVIRGLEALEDEGVTGKSAERFSAALRSCAPYVLLTLIYAAVRYRALGGWSHPTISIGWSAVLLTWPSVLWFYVRHLVVPSHLSEFYALDYVRHFAPGPVLIPLVMVVVAMLALYFAVRTLAQKKAAQFAVALIVVPLLPVLDLRSLTVGDIVHDRYLYLPSAGVAILLALVLVEMGSRSSERSSESGRRLHLFAMTIAILICAAFAALTVLQQMQWASDILLYSRGLESAPANPTVRDNLANALLEADQPARAIPLYLEVISANPGFWRSNYNLGFAYYKTSNYPASEEYLQRAIKIDPSDSDQYIYLALTELHMKKLPEAADNAWLAIAHNPHARGYHSVLGLIYEMAGNRAGAKAALEAEIAGHPDNTSAAAELQKLEGTPSGP